jgi:uncharacterized protein DUF3152
VSTPTQPRHAAARRAMLAGRVAVGAFVLALMVLAASQFVGGGGPRAVPIGAGPLPSTVDSVVGGVSPTPGPLDPTPRPIRAPVARRTPADRGTPTRPAAPRTTTPPVTSSPTDAYLWATTAGPVLGSSGTIYHYRVAVERVVGVAVAGFASVVQATLRDPRSWIAGGVRFQQVATTSSSAMTIYLTSPWTAYAICKAGGIDIRVGGVPYTSCRVGSKVVINSARYLNGIPDYGAPLSAYRQYVVNHEVGHRLGYGHLPCPGPGQLDPVMAQQTLGLDGCLPNSWPYVNGVLYTG